MQLRTYLWAAVFVAANIALPALCHTMGLGGAVLLPILFFTIVATLRYGMVCGVVTAICSPLLSQLITGMPEGGMLAVLLAKSVTIAVVAGLVAARSARVNIYHALLIIISYQLVGAMVVWVMAGSLASAWAQVAISWPAMILQLVAIVLITIPKK